ncbi:hypothetical protein C8R47DRAFT_995934, partial [Mycena vitilis]
YGGQAHVYDNMRENSTLGRESMLSLCASHLRVLRDASPSQRLVWVDVGGGTGRNIEIMQKYFPISNFDAVYIVDLSETLLNAARARIAKNGWTNVKILCQDAQYFRLPEWSNGTKLEGSVGFATLAYCLSSMDAFHQVIDRVHRALSVRNGLVGVVDFYMSDKPHSWPEETVNGSARGWSSLSRLLWHIIFGLYHVPLNPHRLSYVAHKFGLVKSYQTSHRTFPFKDRLPHYIWVGRPRSSTILRHGEQLKMPDLTALDSEQPVGSRPLQHNCGVLAPPLNAFNYHLGTSWRMAYYETPKQTQFRTYIYAFTWEDPEEDMRHLELTSDDSVLAIASAGDNVLHYAISAGPKRIHCVDMNPCQGHLVELKLAAIHALDYPDFFAMFGEGRHPNFRYLLDSKIAPHISAAAYDFWRQNEDAFSSAFYLRGYSGWAIYLMRLVFKCAGVSGRVKDFCNADTLQEQDRIWCTYLRPVMLNPVVVALMKNPIFCWNALGVPLNQRKMLLSDGGVYEYIRDTLDPLSSSYLLKTGAYFYLLCLLGHYTHDSCPAYLTRSGFEKLKANSSKALDAFRLHTDSVLNVLRGLPDHSLTRVVIVDHLDWFLQGSTEVDAEIEHIFRSLVPGGLVFWRSVARKPWYNVNFETMGFQVTTLGVRTGPKTAIDRVNMFSFLLVYLQHADDFQVFLVLQGNEIVLASSLHKLL